MEREELIQEIGKIESVIWYCEIPSAIREWEGYTDEIFEEFDAGYWDDVDDDMTLLSVYDYGVELLSRYNLEQ